MAYVTSNDEQKVEIVNIASLERRVKDRMEAQGNSLWLYSWWRRG